MAMTAKDARGKSVSDLEKQLSKLQEKHAKMRLEVVTKDTMKPSDFTKLRKEIAVVKTVLREKEMSPQTASAKAGEKDA